MMASSLNAKPLVKNLQKAAAQLHARRQEAERSLDKAEQDLELAQTQQAEVTGAIAEFERLVGTSLAQLLGSSHRSPLDGELDEVFAGFQASGDTFTAADVRSALMARERLSPAEMGASRVRNRLDSLVRHGVLRRLPATASPGRLSLFALRKRKPRRARRPRRQRKVTARKKVVGNETIDGEMM